VGIAQGFGVAFGAGHQIGESTRRYVTGGTTPYDAQRPGAEFVQRPSTEFDKRPIQDNPRRRNAA